MLFARLILAAQALIMGGLGLAYWLLPYEMANLNGMLLMESASVSHIRVYYGGLQLGMALFLLWSMRRPERACGALMLVLMTQIALVVARLGSLWLDGGTLLNFDLTSLLYKMAMIALAGLALYLLLRDNRRGVMPLPVVEVDIEELADEYDDFTGPLRRTFREPVPEPLESLEEMPARLPPSAASNP